VIAEVVKLLAEVCELDLVPGAVVDAIHPQVIQKRGLVDHAHLVITA
jgi:hypothetical protein